MLCNAAQEREMGRQKQQLQAAAEHEAQLAAAALAAVETARVSTAPKALAIFKAHIRSTECLYPMHVSDACIPLSEYSLPATCKASQVPAAENQGQS